MHGYKGFDADTYWKMQRVTQGLGSMSMDKDSQKSQSRRLNRRGKLEWKDGKPQWKLLKAEKEKARRAAALRMKTEDALSTFGELRLESKEGEIMKKRKPRQTKAERAAKHADFEARAQDKAKAEMDVTMSKGGDSQSDNWEDI